MLPAPAPKPLRIKLSLKRLQKPDGASEPQAKKVKPSIITQAASTMTEGSATSLSLVPGSDGFISAGMMGTTQYLDRSFEESRDIYSNVVGIEHEEVNSKKRGKIRIGKGSKGSSKNRTKKDFTEV